ncbi:Swm1p NDAI_0H00890 [Naumovozyma dairenensis CBS 421]|uniref:Uncharacterized protein n=1 Tax=Naumovozyma dairenensis (strain ATCC 10597 / BCRC 20456 / CBS 421 / NBRC 0211 / NRRL Y-12639) TaxID=1071378 RepID=G0WEQ2_NAUDC|nr:hypothetical protein NDAI_0H00890 [Naumovozyma dairenensis CBS 421]CCD26263.1 hypothetical protein NDAI_0H00890 [Naumovozyma dairenensis CBS 421]
MNGTASYRDSYFQYQHLTFSHYVLYNEWNQDEFLALDAQELDDSTQLPANEQDGGANTTNNDIQHEKKVKEKTSNEVHDGTYWDRFQDEHDRILFKDVQLDTMGTVTFPFSTETVGGSIFDVRTLKQANNSILGWQQGTAT